MSSIRLTGRTENKLQEEEGTRGAGNTDKCFSSSKDTHQNKHPDPMTPPSCYSGAQVLDVSKSLIPSKTPWCESKKWSDSTCCRFPLEAYQYDLFQMQIGLLIIAVRFLGEEFVRNGNAPLWLIWWGWLPLIKWERGTKDTWRMTSVGRRLPRTGPDSTWWEMEISGFADFCLSRTTLISAAPSLLILVENGKVL